MRYAKGHGTGNDFIVLPDADGRLDLTPALVRRLCDRHTGIGADGVLRAVLVGAAGPDAAGAGATDGAEWFMDYRNADGSVAEMCGNGVRVFARYLIGHGLAAGPDLAVATRAGIRRVRQRARDVFTVEMGPAAAGGSTWAVIGGTRHAGLAVSVGNPHLACLVGRPVAEFDLALPPLVDPAVFPAGVNVEVVRMTGDLAVEMRVHERGSGETLSCGTGAVAAAVAAAVAVGRWPDGEAAGDGAEWAVHVPGGRLAVLPSSTASLLTGPAEIVAEGEISPGWLAGAGAAAQASGVPRASATA
ncbi:MAG TPA: diaminopimelate epimerase [Streptosporangiaceae bacterium]|nr:diaminopimelate epimerase [Streptosporangiaceae bacterium]